MRVTYDAVLYDAAVRAVCQNSGILGEFREAGDREIFFIQVGTTNDFLCLTTH